MKRVCLFLIGVMILCVGACFPALAGDNLLDNSGFEDQLDYWSEEYGSSAEVTTDYYYSGSYSASKDVNSVSGQEYWSRFYQDVEISPGDPVYASMYLKTTFSPEATAKAGLMLQFLDDDDNILDDSIQSKEIGGATDWRKLEATYSSAPSSTTKVRISGYLWAKEDDTVSLTGNAYFDEAYLAKEDQSVSLPSTLYNSDFENGLHDWTDSSYPSTLSSDTRHAGSYAAAQEVSTVSSRDYWAQLYQEVSCASGKKAEAKMYVKTNFDNSSKAKSGVMIECLDSSGAVIKTNGIANSGMGKQRDWKKLACKIAKTPKNTVKLRYSAYIYAPKGDTSSLNGKAYFDDASLTIK